MPTDFASGRNVAMGAVRVTEAAAIAASRLMGQGDDRKADESAVEAMSLALRELAINGTVRVGEEGNDCGLNIGDKVGNGDGPAVDIALMPLEGATIVAKGEANALSVIAMAEEGGFLDVPDVYMDKIAVGGGLPDGLIDLDKEPVENLEALAKAKNMDVEDIVVCILDRPRHGKLIEKIRAAGARIMLIADGDVSGAIATTWPESGIDIYLGIGGARQGILAAAALKGVGGQMQGRLVFRNEDDRRAAHKHGITNFDYKYTLSDMAKGDVTIAATGITNGAILAGVRRNHGVTVTHSLVMRSKTGTLRSIEAYHNFASQGS